MPKIVYKQWTDSETCVKEMLGHLGVEADRTDLINLEPKWVAYIFEQNDMRVIFNFPQGSNGMFVYISLMRGRGVVSLGVEDCQLYALVDEGAMKRVIFSGETAWYEYYDGFVHGGECPLPDDYELVEDEETYFQDKRGF